MAANPVSLDFSKAVPIAGAEPAPPTSASALQGAVSYASQQDPVKYAKLLQLQKITGIHPVVAQGNEPEVQQQAATNSIDPHFLTTMAPQTSTWASDPDNAAVSGVDGIHNLAGIEQNAIGMRAYTPTFMDKAEGKLSSAYQFLAGQTPDQTKQRLYEYPLTRGAIDMVGGAAGMVGDIGSAVGWHGNGPTSQNLLQRIEAGLSPENNTDPQALFHQNNQFDTLMKNVAPMVPAILATGGVSLLADTLKLSGTAAKVLAGLSVGGIFDLSQAGKTYTSMKGAGASDFAARLAANRTAVFNAPANALFGATETAPLLRDNPFLTSLGVGGAVGASGQVSQNVITGKPLTQGVLSSAVQGAAVQGGMHLGTQAFFGHLAQATEAAQDSPLRKIAPDKFAEANHVIFQGDSGLQIPVDKFNEHFQSQKIDPQQAASSVGATNYPEAVVSGGNVEVPKANYLSALDSEHQNGLFPHIVDPISGMTLTEHQEGMQELQDWAANGGAEKLQAETARADAESTATPEWQAVKEDLRQRYIDAGETPEVAETLAIPHANVVSNLARASGRTPAELMAMYNPKVVAGEAPIKHANRGTYDPNDPNILHQSAPLPQGEAGDAALGRAGSTESSPEVANPEIPESEKVASRGDQPRGWMNDLPDGSVEIGKTPTGDLSTFAHEGGHSYLKLIRRLAASEGASDVLKGDYQKILDFLGAKDGEPLTVAQHETFARAEEQYLREGKAPSENLKGVFQRFSIWLHAIYKKASDLGVELTAEMREVFGRLHASEEGVDRAATEAGPHLFTTPEEAGWTEDEFKKYAETNNVSVEQAKSHILGMLNEAAIRDRSEAWLDEEKNVRQAQTDQIDTQPAYKAIHSLRKGELEDGSPLTLNKEALVNQFGEERVKELQRLHPGLYRTDGGVDGETAAEIHGYGSAEEMMRALEATPRRSAAIAQATRDYMTAKHGDIRYDGTLDDSARLALENDTKVDGLYSELKALKGKLTDLQGKTDAQKKAMRDISVAPISAYRDAAYQMIESKSSADLQPSRYLDATRKYSREAFDALRRGDTQEAWNAKHKELMNHFLFRDATKAKKYLDKFEGYAKKSLSKTVQGKLGLAGDDHQDQFNHLMARYGMAQDVQPERSLSDYAKAQFEAYKDPAIDPFILDENRVLNYRNAPISEIRMVHDAMVNIRKLASLELGIEINGKKIIFNDAIEAMAAKARESIKSKPRRVLQRNATVGEKALDFVHRGDAMMERTEFLMKRLDDGYEGPWHDNLWNLAADAQGHDERLNEDVTKRIGDSLAAIPKEQRLSRYAKVSVDGIPETVTRHDLVSMAFNMGNDGNLERLQKTFLAHGWNPEVIESIKGMLTREEWQFVQNGWDSLKPLGKAQSELERDQTGLAPIMVRPTPLHLKLADGSEMDLDGGYYPVVMDPKYSTRGAEQAAGTTAQNLMEAGYGRATTSRGNMKERTGYGGPLKLDYEQVLTQETTKVAKDISHRKFILAANKMLMDPRIRTTLQETMGDGYEDKMMPWLRTLVNDRNGSAVQGLGELAKWTRQLRTNMVKASLYFKASTVLLQLTHASSLFLHTSPTSFGQSMVDFLAHPSDMTEQIRSLSPNEMHNRGDNIDRDMRRIIKEGANSNGITKTIGRAGMFPVKMIDHLLSFPLWLAAYRDALKAHAELPEDQAQHLAMHRADAAVRMGIGSNAPKDLPPIMRSDNLAKVLTTLGGFSNLKYNQITDVARAGIRTHNFAQAAYRLGLAAVFPAVVGEMVTGHGPKDGENMAEWAAQRALLFPVETIPVLGSIVYAMETKGEVKFSPLASIATRLAAAGSKAKKGSDADWTEIALDLAEAGGEITGLPGTGQATKMGRYLHAVQQGRVANPNITDAIVGGSRK